MRGAGGPRRIAVVVKGYPRLSETFIAQEILGLETRRVPLEIWSLRHPTEKAVHPMHRRIRARVKYLPEYLHREPLRVLRGFLWGLRQPRFQHLARVFWRDLVRDPTPNRIRRFGQACVLARELPPAVAHLHVHYLHTPASVVRYAALLTGRTWTLFGSRQGHLDDAGLGKAQKMAESLWGVTCTTQAALNAVCQALAPSPERVTLAYHGLDLARFPPPPDARPERDGSDPADPVRIVRSGGPSRKKALTTFCRRSPRCRAISIGASPMWAAAKGYPP